MAKILIQDIAPAGTELFQDSESYLRDLKDNEVSITGGAMAACTPTSGYTTLTIYW